MNQKEENDFIRKYFKLGKVKYRNIICHDANTVKEHRNIVSDVCEWLRENNMVFFTRVYTKWGEIIDIVAPDLPRPFLEIRHSELKKDKEYLSDYDGLRIFIDTTDPWKLL